jgi:hypothetical protein
MELRKTEIIVIDIYRGELNGVKWENGKGNLEMQY